MEIFSTVLSLGQTLYEMGEAAKANQEDCQSLADLAMLVAPVVEELKLKYRDGSALDPTLELYISNLKEALMDAQRIVQKLQTRNVLKRYLKGDDTKRARRRIKDVLDCEWVIMVRLNWCRDVQYFNVFDGNFWNIAKALHFSFFFCL